MKILYCEGVRITGYWKGNKCCAVAVYRSTNDGKTWCRNHAPYQDRCLEIIRKEKK